MIRVGQPTKNRKTAIYTVILLLFAFTICGCVTGSKSVFDASAFSKTEGYQSLTIMGQGFQHLVLAKQGKNTDDEIITFVLHGDGLPWLARGKIAADPTSEHDVSVKIWENTQAPAFFVGRPCYFGLDDENCHPGYWTDARFSQDVVDSLSAVVEQLHEPYLNYTIRLVGYSGGGVLATLLASKLAANAQTASSKIELVTFAAPLDIDAWVDLHGYSTLKHSLNPVELEPAKALKQWHFYGERDQNVPIEVVKTYFDRPEISGPILIKAFDHHCCWGDFDWRGLRDKKP